MERNSSTVRSPVISHLGLRKAIGIIGFMLPFVLAIGKVIIDGPGIENSISSYYHTGMRDIFVGAMCAIGVFLFAYRGYDNRDAIAGNLASMCAIGLALVPTAPDFAQSSREHWIGTIHLVFSAGFFLTLAYFCLFLFIKTNPGKTVTRKKLQRNQVYKMCGALIVIALLLIVVVKQFRDNAALMHLHPVFWLESVAVLAFGVSWLTKGEAFLKDEPDHLVVSLLSGD